MKTNFDRSNNRRAQVMHMQNDKMLSERRKLSQQENEPDTIAKDSKESTDNIRTSIEDSEEKTQATRKLISDKSDNIEVGTQAHYNLVYTGEEVWSSNSKRTYKWSVINPDGSIRYTEIKDSTSLTLTAKIPGNYTIQVEVLNNGESTNNVYSYSQSVYFEKRNTELGGLSVGNFDFRFDGTSVWITVRVKFLFEKNITDTDQVLFKAKFFDAIKTYWTASGVSFEADSGNCFIKNIPLIITCYENNSNYHKLVDVEKEYRRPKVISDMNVYYAIDKETIAHEFGHVLGLYDNYDGGTLENIMFWHDNKHIKDTAALMNTGGELRKLYFEHYLNQLNEVVDTGCKYKIKAPFN